MKDISLDQPLARGRTADVFAWEPGQVLKLFHNWFPLENIEYEQRIGRAVHASGGSAPAVIGEIIRVKGRNGRNRQAGTGLPTLSGERETGRRGG